MTTTGSACPDCGSWSSRVHSFYLRFPADMPTAGRRVVVCLHVRRSFCPNAPCGRRTFVEQVPGLTRRHSRWNERLRSTLAGRAGAWMARVFGGAVSRSTVLRLVHAFPQPEVPAPRVVGGDEYATHKGRVRGTILVDIEARRPVVSCPTARRPAWPEGSPNGPASRSSAETELPSSWRAPRPGRPKRSRSPTGLADAAGPEEPRADQAIGAHARLARAEGGAAYIGPLTEGAQAGKRKRGAPARWVGASPVVSSWGRREASR
ncbi:transposase family protein [Streptomyces sp. 8K308]|uniref:transposase family protein n=1 Tax=Streptomyces sp. 8K308 TaxID=2530388 RepID=UPI0032652E5E